MVQVRKSSRCTSVANFFSSNSSLYPDIIKGRLSLSQSGPDSPLRITGTLEREVAVDSLKSNNSNNKHGFHIHTKGELGNACKDAGGHFNPKGVSTIYYASRNGRVGVELIKGPAVSRRLQIKGGQTGVHHLPDPWGQTKVRPLELV